VCLFVCLKFRKYYYFVRCKYVHTPNNPRTLSRMVMTMTFPFSCLGNISLHIRIRIILLFSSVLYSMFTGSTPKPCQFPSWAQSHQWHTLDQRSTFAFDSSTLRVSNSSDPAGISPSTLSMTAVCHQILDNPTLDKVMLVLQSTSEW